MVGIYSKDSINRKVIQKVNHFEEERYIVHTLVNVRSYSLKLCFVTLVRRDKLFSLFPAVYLSNNIIQPASFTFAGLIACQQRPLLTRLEKDFEHQVTKRVNELCVEGLSCSVQDLETTCEHSEGRWAEEEIP